MKHTAQVTTQAGLTVSIEYTDGDIFADVSINGLAVDAVRMDGVTLEPHGRQINRELSAWIANIGHARLADALAAAGGEVPLPAGHSVTRWATGWAVSGPAGELVTAGWATSTGARIAAHNIAHGLR